MNDQSQSFPPLPDGHLVRAAIRSRLRELAALQRREERMRRLTSA